MLSTRWRTKAGESGGGEDELWANEANELRKRHWGGSGSHTEREKINDNVKEQNFGVEFWRETGCRCLVVGQEGELRCQQRSNTGRLKQLGVFKRWDSLEKR